MTRREAVRVVLFERARLVGLGGGVRCAIIDLSAAGARVSMTAQRLPRPPLRLEFELGDGVFSLAAEIRRAAPGEHLALRFTDPPTDQLHRLIAGEQRRALASGRTNVHDRRSRRTGPAARGEVMPDRRPKAE